DGDDLYAEVSLPHDTDTTGHTLHPALLDAALHALLVADPDAPLRVPFSWSGVTVHAGGATRLRVRLRRNGPDTATLALADPTGAPVAGVAELVLRAADFTGPADASAGARDPLYVLRWREVPAELPTDATVPASSWAVLGKDGAAVAGRLGARAHHADLAGLRAALDAGAPVPSVVVLPVRERNDDVLAAAHASAEDTLAVVQEWLADERLADARLVVVTRGTVAAGREPVVTPSAVAVSTVWGLLRTAQAETAGHFTLVDLSPDPASDGGPDDLGEGGGPAAETGLLPAAVATGQEQLAVRDGLLFAPALTRAGAVAPGTAADAAARGRSFDPEGTVLITGGTGALGSLLARHLVTHHGARHLI
ncbi:polyketide synthase dehydratase domain-containing protein, partial [Streptomyces atroolivaceus]